MAHDETGEISVTEAALRLRISRERVIRRIQSGLLEGRRDKYRGWCVSESALAAIAEQPALPVRQPA